MACAPSGRAAATGYRCPPTGFVSSLSSRQDWLMAVGRTSRQGRALVCRPRAVLSDDVSASLHDRTNATKQEGEALVAVGIAPEWARKSDNPALAGNFAPVEGEITVGDLRIDGVLPEDLDGVYLRNGPNQRWKPHQGAPRYHWFDGCGMAHWVRLDGSKQWAAYGRRYIETAGYAQEDGAGRALYTGLRDINPIWHILLPRLAVKVANWRAPDSPFWVVQSKNTANNGLTWHGGKLLATYESGSAYELDPSTPDLATRGLADFGGELTTKDYWLDNMTAHGKVCPVTGELVYIGYNLITPESMTSEGGEEGATSVTIGVIAPDGTRVHREEVPVLRPSMQHDVGITSTRTVLLDGPLIFDLERVMNGGLPFAFHKDQTLRVGVIPRRGKAEDVTWIDTGENGFVFHFVNCFDDPTDPEGNRVVVDVCKADGTNALGMAGTVWRTQGSQGVAGVDSVSMDEDDPSGAPAGPVNVRPTGEGRDVGVLWRWVVDAAKGELVSSERRCAVTSDFPCINPTRIGLAYRWAYTTAYTPGSEPKVPTDIPTFDRVLKHDTSTGAVAQYHLGLGRACGDIVFVPSSSSSGGSDEEEDGYLLVLSHVLDEEEPRAELLVLGGSDGELGLIATVHVPTRVPFGFHCEYMPGPLPPAWSPGPRGIPGGLHRGRACTGAAGGGERDPGVDAERFGLYTAIKRSALGRMRDEDKLKFVETSAGRWVNWLTEIELKYLKDYKVEKVLERSPPDAVEAAEGRVTAIVAPPPSQSPGSPSMSARPHVVVFSFASCPWCVKAKAALREAGVEFASFELDEMGDEGVAVQGALGKLTGRTSMPNVFVNGESIGGCMDGTPGVLQWLASAEAGGGLDQGPGME